MGLTVKLSIGTILLPSKLNSLPKGHIYIYFQFWSPMPGYTHDWGSLKNLQPKELRND